MSGLGLPVLSTTADTRTTSERVNVLIRERNLHKAQQTVANLPSASAQGAMARSFVSDANATTFASVVAGGGANFVPIYSDGVDWRIG